MTNSQPGIFRPKFSHESDFVIIPNDWIRNTGLQPSTNFLLVYLLTHEIGYEIKFDQIERETNIGIRGIRSAIKELAAAGWMKAERQRQKDGRMGAYRYTITQPVGKYTKEPKTTVLNATVVETTVVQGSDLKKTTNTEDKVKENKTKNTYSDDFENFWKSYPRHEGSKAKAAKAYEFAVGGNGTTVLFGALELWLRHPLKQDKTYWPYAERWLRDCRFNDELPQVPGQTNRKIVGDF
jgi:predicted transcriptional regulator